jgi:hypothetical protein
MKNGLYITTKAKMGKKRSNYFKAYFLGGAVLADSKT